MSTEHKLEEWWDGSAFYWHECGLCGYKIWHREGSCNLFQTAEFYETEEYKKCPKLITNPKFND